MRHVNIPLFIPHLGCKNECVFCNQRSITGLENKVTIEQVKEIITQHLSTIGEDDHVEISFFGGSFTGLPLVEQIEYLEIAGEYIDGKRVAGIRVSTRPDYIDENILKLLKSYGVTTIELGVQSLDDKVLILSSRGHTIEDVIKAANLIKFHGFKLGIQLMIGLPGDDFDISVRTAYKVVSLKPDFVRIYPTLVIKGTKLAKMLEERAYSPVDLDEAIEITSEMMKIFLSSNINIIRVGLQPTEILLKGDDFIAGPFHPSFKYLVETKMYETFFKNFTFEEGKPINIRVAPKSKSTMIGNRAINYKYLMEISAGQLIITEDNTLDPYEMIIIHNSKETQIKVYEEV